MAIAETAAKPSARRLVQGAQMAEQGEQRHLRGAGRPVLGLQCRCRGPSLGWRRGRSPSAPVFAITPGTALHHRRAAAPGAGDHVGWARIAAPIRARAARLIGASLPGSASLAAARARPHSGSGWLGRLQPSMPGSGSRSRPASAAIAAAQWRCTAWLRAARSLGSARPAGEPPPACRYACPSSCCGAGAGSCRLAGRAQRPGRCSGGMRAAGEGRLVETEAREPSFDQGHMSGSPPCEAQASASSASLDPKRVGGTALDQRQGLERLDRRARIDGLVDVADGKDRPTVGVGDAARTRCRLSTRSPRQTSTATGVAAISCPLPWRRMSHKLPRCARGSGEHAAAGLDRGGGVVGAPRGGSRAPSRAHGFDAAGDAHGAGWLRPARATRCGMRWRCWPAWRSMPTCRLPLWLWAAGAVLFSFSLYALALGAPRASGLGDPGRRHGALARLGGTGLVRSRARP